MTKIAFGMQQFFIQNDVLKQLKKILKRMEI